MIYGQHFFHIIYCNQMKRGKIDKGTGVKKQN